MARGLGTWLNEMSHWADAGIGIVQCTVLRNHAPIPLHYPAEVKTRKYREIIIRPPVWTFVMAACSVKSVLVRA
jgi:hypothetical protein